MPKKWELPSSTTRKSGNNNNTRMNNTSKTEYDTEYDTEDLMNAEKLSAELMDAVYSEGAAVKCVVIEGLISQKAYDEEGGAVEW